MASICIVEKSSSSSVGCSIFVPILEVSTRNFSVLISSLGSARLESDTPNSEVITLDSNIFDEKVLNSDDIWLVLFYNKENEELKYLKPEYEKAALAMKGIFKLGAINAKSEKILLSKYNITSTPTMKFFGKNKEEKPKDFDTQLRARFIIEKMFLRVQSYVNSKINITDDEAMLYDIEHNPNIVQLNNKNFDESIQKNELMWLIVIYSPKCGICKDFLPIFVKAYEKVKDIAVFAMINGLINRQSAKRFDITGYPHILVYSPGFGRLKKVEEYNGPRDEDGLVDYIIKKNERYDYVKEPPQIISQDVLNRECLNKEGHCIITLFPNIMKSSAKERNSYIRTIHNLSYDYKPKSVHFVWAQEGDFHKMEEKLKINKYPVMIGVDLKKKFFSVKKFNSDFEQKILDSYIKNLLEGKENMMNNVGELEISKTEKWDRKDYLNEDL